MNWGWRIAIFFSAFVVFILTMVIRSTYYKIELEADNYYEKELEFDDQMSRKKNAFNLSEEISYQIVNDKVIVQFPSEVASKIEGEILFLRPSDENLDLTLDIEVDNQNHFQIDKQLFTKGAYKMKVDWKAGEEEYYSEKEITIN